LDNSNQYKDLLKKENLRNTKHRNSILEIMNKSDQPLTAEAIFLELKKQGLSISFSTVYRALETLLNKALVVKSSVTDDNKALYEINCQEHRHHLLCVKCRKIFSVNGCPLKEYEKSLEKKYGFTISSHKLVMYGICDHCKATKEKE
jgi:Fur family ferric uptake transcriptional regulator